MEDSRTQIQSRFTQFKPESDNSKKVRVILVTTRSSPYKLCNNFDTSADREFTPSEWSKQIFSENVSDRYARMDTLGALRTTYN
ncbi:MAG: hypothetical protein WBC88_05580 [Candidatus Zixiibacteriota bacterium]